MKELKHPPQLIGGIFINALRNPISFPFSQRRSRTRRLQGATLPSGEIVQNKEPALRHRILPPLMIFVVKIIDERKINDILIFSLFYIFWLSGGHIIYMYMHLMMLSIFYFITAFVFYKSSIFKAVNLKRIILLYLLLFIVPLLGVIYQYYFIYDVVSASNRMKQGLIISPFESTGWKQLLVSFQSSSYFWVGLILIICYTGLKILASKYKFINVTRSKIPLWFLLLIIPILYGVLYKSINIPAKSYGDNAITNGDFEVNIFKPV